VQNKKTFICRQGWWFAYKSNKQIHINISSETWENWFILKEKRKIKTRYTKCFARLKMHFLAPEIPEPFM
jgi:hypothetical protein